MIDTRVITLLTMRNGRLVKSINFKNHKYIGDPINSVKIFTIKSVMKFVYWISHIMNRI